MQKLHQMKHRRIIVLIVILCGIVFQQCGSYFNIFLSTSVTIYDKKKTLFF